MLFFVVVKLHNLQTSKTLSGYFEYSTEFDCSLAQFECQQKPTFPGVIWFHTDKSAILNASPFCYS